MKVKNYLKNTISEEGAAHLTLVDPDEQEPKSAGEIAALAESAGTDCILIGGSTDAGGNLLEKTIREINLSTDIPNILFPANHEGVGKSASAIFFMSLLNSTDPFYIIGAQMKGAPMVKKLGIEPISLAYLIVEPGGKVGKVGKADLIARDDIESAVSYSLASSYLGMEVVYLEAGSGSERPVSTEMIKAVRESVDSILIVGGGIRTPELAKKRVEAGADVIVTGTLVEESEDKLGKIKDLVESIKS